MNNKISRNRIKINVYNIYLIFLNTIFYALLSVGILWIIFFFFFGIFIAISYNATPLKVLAWLGFYTSSYTAILSLVFYSKNHIEQIAKKKDGKHIVAEAINYKSEVARWAKLCVVLTVISFLAAYSVPLFVCFISIAS